MAGCSLAGEDWSRDPGYPSFFVWMLAERALQPGHKALGRLGAWEDGSSGEPDCTSDAPYPGRAAARLDGAQPGFTDSPGLSQIHLGVSRQGVNPGKSSTSNRPVLEKPVNNSTFPVSLQK